MEAKGKYEKEKPVKTLHSTSFITFHILLPLISHQFNHPSIILSRYQECGFSLVFPKLCPAKDFVIKIQIFYIFFFQLQACEKAQKYKANSHYVCDDKGDVKCLPGWQGDLCQVPMCRKSCDPMNGLL